jgi:DNA replication protein DnaC
MRPTPTCERCGREADKPITPDNWNNGKRLSYPTSGREYAYEMDVAWHRSQLAEGRRLPSEDFEPVPEGGVGMDYACRKVFCTLCAREVGRIVWRQLTTDVRRAALARRAPHTSRGIESLEAFAAADDHAAEAVEAVEAWRADPTRNLVLYGDAGVGKTTLAYLLALERFDAYPMGEVEWLRVDKAVAALKASFDGEPKPAWKLWADLLVLDDLGAERVTTWTRDEVVGPMIRDRYDTGKPSIVTTNFAPPALAARLTGDEDPIIGKRLIGRLVGEGAVVVEVNGGDRRV